MFKRFVERRAEEALSDTPVVLIVGPRRAGKTTLVKKMGEAGRTYITLDDQTVLEAARSDPAGFIRGLDRAIIDEIYARPTCCWRSRRRSTRTIVRADFSSPAQRMC